MDSAKKIYRDSLFRDYFRVKENFAQLCNAVTGLNLQADRLSENTVEDVLFSNVRNDVSFSADGKCFVFFEHQSTKNFNMPLRMLFYLSMLYRRSAGEDLIYRAKLIELPAPKFFVFYNGKEPCPEVGTLKLSDAFSMPGDIELTVKVFNVNYNKDFRLIRECRPMHDYSFFVDRVEANRAAGMSRGDAIIAAMRWCIDNDIMRDYLKIRMQEVFEMVSLWWNEEDARKSYIAQGREEGIAQGERKTLLGNIRNLMDSLHLTAEAAMNALKISPEMQKELAPLI